MSREVVVAVKAEGRKHGPGASQRIARSEVKLSLRIYRYIDIHIYTQRQHSLELLFEKILQ